MARTNVLEKGSSTAPKTHEGAEARRITPEQELERSVMACLLFEGEFYEDGVMISERIKGLVAKVKPDFVAKLAVKARTEGKLRHVPLLLCVSLSRIGKLKAEVLASVIQRPDELTEFLSLYWKEGKCPISAQAKKGLALAFAKFNAYSLAKYNRDAPIKLRDVLFMCHAKPKDEKQSDVFKKLADGTLGSPDTWEVALSGGADKCVTR